MSALDEVRALYEQLPTIECKGLCANSCGPIDMTDAERGRLTDLGVTIPVFTQADAQAWARGERLDCPALVGKGKHPLTGDRTGRCSVYEDRPLICRLWGLTESMPCPHGCRPSRVMPDAEGFELIFEAMEVGGHRDYANLAHIRYVRERYERWSEDPELGPLFARLIRGDTGVESKIEAIINARSDQG